MVISGVAWTTIASATVRIFAAVSNLILAKLLAPEVFGIIAIAQVVIGAMELFSDFGIGRALIQYKGDVNKAANTALTLRMSQGFILFLIAFIFAGEFAGYYNTPELRYIVLILGINFLVFAAGAIPWALISKELQFRKLVIPQTLPALLQVITTITLAYIRRDVWSIVAGMVVMNLSKTILYWHVSPLKLRLGLNKIIARRLLGFGIPLFASGLVWYMVYNLGSAVIGKKLEMGMEMLGYYSFAFIIISLPTTEIVYVINGVMFPTYSLLSDNLPDLRNAYLKTLKYIALAAVPLNIGIPLFGGDLFQALYDTKWIDAIAPLQAFAVYAFMRAFGATAGNVFLALGKTKYMLISSLVCLTILAVFIIPVVDKYGITGVAALFSIAWTITLWLLFMWLKKILGVNFADFFRAIRIPLLASILAMLPLKYIAGRLLDLHNIINLIIVLVFVVIIYIAIIYKLDPVASESMKRSFKERKPVLL